MPSTEEMQIAIRENAEALAEVRARVDGHDEDIARHERHIAKLDDAVVMLRETIGRVATKDDIADLRKDISSKFDKQLVDAQNSVPGKVAVVFTAGMFLIALVELVVNVVRHG